ncbi:50S ribosomal protein L22 [Candidatus Woesebacteria bacterium RIFCSPHIGHO2_01_FULL_44_21]|uniref:Large ribosomal subunit protein uL22 n=1 Tax=Candidatus Woesebacteria bacterium RIFCSPHIGHO2_01_FULL_44_21 TaxID=1802503 RepID=A0A1F7Z159_9BACT|nr:MAG: 50S ribosomal protein L22 [Candidatus Woesebacteria bacterium RIFCSPHIGHO2_01_FULL_44_21]OGM71483.1 MAG: 50S ribosomal protein L22 [Candidatus Woesebacteria bacterium RIFCSPLOWO2_01_FULL_44_24b]
MQAISTQKFVRIAPRKLRLIADMVRGKSVSEVLEALPFVRKDAVKPVEKVIKSASANAKVKGANPAELVISKIEISEGPRLKRFRPVSRGQAHGYVRAMSHIKVVVTTKSEARNPKSEIKTENTKINKKKEGEK